MIRAARFVELNAPTLFGILRLRQDVFVVEQDCVYADIDDRDVEPRSLHLWAEEDGTVVSCLRLLDEGAETRIGRVCTSPSARHRGLAGALISRALELGADRPTVIAAQAHLEEWYAKFGFVVCGGQFVEDGIRHVPMRRPNRRE